MFFIKLERFSAIISSNILSVSSFLSTPSEIPVIHMLRLLLVFYRSLRLCSFFFLFFFFFLKIDHLNELFSSSLSVSSAFSSLSLRLAMDFSY